MPNSHFKLINNWYFDFKHMRAHRAKKWVHYQSCQISMIYLEMGDDGKIYKADQHSPLGWDQMEFFDEPEVNYNEDINRAYIDYLFETQVLI